MKEALRETGAFVIAMLTAGVKSWVTWAYVGCAALLLFAGVFFGEMLACVVSAVMVAYAFVFFGLAVGLQFMLRAMGWGNTDP